MGERESLGPAGLLKTTRRQLVLLQGGLAGAAALGAWMAVPYLFSIDEVLLDETRRLFLPLVLLAVAAGAVLTRALTRHVGTLADRLALGSAERVDRATGEAALRELHRFPSLFAGIVLAGGTGVVVAIAVYGHLRLDVPFNTAGVATLYGLCITLWLALVLSTATRLLALQASRLFSRLGLARPASGRVPLTWRVGTLLVLAVTSSSVFVGAVTYHFADAALAEEVGRRTAGGLPAWLGEAAVLQREGAATEWVEAALNRARAQGDGVRLALARGHRVVAGDPDGLDEVMGLHAYRVAAGKAGFAVTPRTLDVVAWAPTQVPGLIAMGRVKRADVAGPLARQGRTVLAFILVTTLLGGVLGAVLARSIQVPLQDVRHAADRVAGGDLCPPETRSFSDDEIGEVSDRVESMRGRLSELVAHMLRLSDRTRQSGGDLLEQAAGIGEGADATAEAVDTAGVAIEELDRSLQSVAESARQMASAFRTGQRGAAGLGDDFDRLSKDVENVAARAAQAAGLVGEFSRDTERLGGEAVQLSEASARAAGSVAEVSASLSRVQKHAEGAAGAAEETIAVAQRGAVSVRRNAEGMARIRESSEAVAGRVEDLAARFADVRAVLSVIDEIAERTNLLALNASIIAAQAGEHGRSFAVVAGEIRDLAHRTAASTREIASTVQEVGAASAEVSRILRDSQSRVAEGVDLSGEAEESLNEILLTAAQAGHAAQAIVEAAAAQAQAVEGAAEEIERTAGMAERIADLGRGQARASAGTRQTVEEIATLNGQVHRAAASLAGRNRDILSGFRGVGDHVTRVEKSLEEISRAFTSILEQVERIREVAGASAEHAGRVESAAQGLDAAAADLQDGARQFTV